MFNINNFIKENYKLFTAKELAYKLGLTLYAVQSRVNSLGLKKGSRKYECNLSFFEKPNDNNSYWAGFIAADGTIRAKQNQITLHLSSKDVEHIKRFCVDIEYNGPIKNRKVKKKKNTKYKKSEYFSSGVDLCGANKNIKYLNENYNISNNKSLTLKPPNNLSLSNKEAFIKGLIDGDGSILLGKNGRIELSIVGTYEILSYIKEYFDVLVPSKTKHNPKVRYRKDRTKNNHCTYKVTGFRAYKILNLLKSRNTPELKRKWGVLDLVSCPKYKSTY